MSCVQKSLVSVSVSLSHVRVLANCRLCRLSRQSLPSAYGKQGNEVKLGAVHRSPGIDLTPEEVPGKSRQGDRLMNAVRPFIASNDVGGITQCDGGDEGRK